MLSVNNTLMLLTTVAINKEESCSASCCSGLARSNSLKYLEFILFGTLIFNNFSVLWFIAGHDSDQEYITIFTVFLTDDEIGSNNESTNEVGYLLADKYR